jgi:cell division septal protein FtsQ
MIKNLFKRVKSQKGMSGVLVALLLVVIGVGLVAGLNSYMSDAKTAIEGDANTSLKNAGITGY